MSDEALRAAEREARAHPDDPEARRRYLRALERAGQGPEAQRALWTSLCRRAREGDAPADDALERWTSSGSPAATATSVDLARAHVTAIPRAHPTRATPVAITRTRVVCVDGRSLLAHDLLDRREAWRHDAIECLPALAGDDLVQLDQRGLVVRDPATGDERRRWSVGGVCLRVVRGFAVTVADGAARPGLGVPLGGYRREATCVDLLAPGSSALWTTGLERDTASIVGTRHGLVRELAAGTGGGLGQRTIPTSWDLHLVDVSTGAPRRLREPAPSDEPILSQDLASPDGTSLLFRASHGERDATRVGELELPSGGERWRLDAPWPSRDLWAGPGLALVRRREAVPGALVALDRATGRPRWEARPGPVEALGFVGDQVVLAAVTDAGVMVLTALSTHTGQVVASHRVPLGVPPSAPRDFRVRLVVAAEGVRVAVTGPTEVLIVEVPAG